MASEPVRQTPPVAGRKSPAWHAMPAAAALAELGSSAQGLSSQEADQRLRLTGPNQLQSAPPASALLLFLAEFRSPLILVLLASAVLLFAVAFVGHDPEQNIDAALILTIVLINGILGFVQNFRAQRGIEALQRLSAPTASFLRDGVVRSGPASMLVPGDVALLEEGDRVPADGRLIEAYDLRLDESPLTGESLPVAKDIAPLPGAAALADRTNMAYLGATVMRGRGRMVIAATGMITEVGQIAREIQAAPDGPTPFQRRVAQLGRWITIIIAGLLVIIASLQLLVGHFSLLETFVASVALAVAAIPEGLPVVLTLALALGTRRMLERRCLVRSLPVVEIVGSADVICSDKTGTITEGRMSLRTLFWQERFLEVTGEAAADTGQFLDQGTPTDQRDNPALLAAGLCNNAQRNPDGVYQGDPTETALLAGVHKGGVDLAAWTRTDEIPFSSERRMMSVVARRGAEHRVFVKGAPEVVIRRCTRVQTPDGPAPLTDEAREHLLQVTSQLAGQALRVLALAGKDGLPPSREQVEQDLVFLGFAGLNDPPREAARRAVADAAQAGIRVVMITGDNLATALAIAREVGISGEGVEGSALNDLDDAAVTSLVNRVSVFARAEPVHKLRLTRALQESGQVVVMTGDGVNDAPALKGADVGIAMGVRGTDVARDASDMVLLDDNFDSIVAAVEEGRRTFANIKKFVTYLLVSNLAEVLVVLAASLFGILPVTAVQILWINLVTDGIPAMALGLDPAAPGLMGRALKERSIIGRGMIGHILGVGLVQTVITLGSFVAGLVLFDLETARTIAFTSFPLQEYGHLVVLRRLEGAPLLKNRWLVLAVAASLSLQLLVIYSPLGGLFGVIPLGLIEWGILLGGMAAGLLASILVAQWCRRWLGEI